MPVDFKDLIPKNRDLLEKSTIHLGRTAAAKDAGEKVSPRADQKSTILQIPLESELEMELAKVRYTQEEIERIKQERARKIKMAYQSKANAWSKKIKSRAYRKAKREEKQRKVAEKIKIQLAVGSDCDEFEAQEVHPKEADAEIKTAEEKAYDFLRNTVNPEPVQIINTHTGDARKGHGIESILEVDDAEFAAEKKAAAEEDRPWEREEVLVGWNTWGGLSVEPVKNSSNTKKVSRTGVEIRKRKDFEASHVIYNEKAHTTRNPKYAINQLPYGYETMEEYNTLMDLPVSACHQPTIILNRLIKAEKEKRKHL
ncbi:uncharacterized protein NEMAJ01_1400 [Nematocida major]|uniref:uncharacterized protein n=1 Tax=Nematocida major TaxID=1912982 RepID=UPI00200766D5|nr:uncharacterized protein NEMAJ01_1400 [Nematocida major]KAH9386504.1 hypothetical protein NEMAJ01_1400 [Nematocida major]